MRKHQYGNPCPVQTFIDGDKRGQHARYCKNCKDYIVFYKDQNYSKDYYLISESDVKNLFHGNCPNTKINFIWRFIMSLCQ